MSVFKYPGLLVEISAALLVLLFTYAAVNKLIDHAIFRIQLMPVPFIADYREIFAWLIPIAELVIVLLLAVKQTRYWGFSLSFVILLFFTAYLLISLSMNKELPCQCGGVISRLSWGQHIALNIFFLLISGLGLLANRRHYKQISTNSKDVSDKIILDQNRESTFIHPKN